MFDNDTLEAIRQAREKSKRKMPDNNRPTFRPVQPQEQSHNKTREEDQKYKRDADKGDYRRNRGWNALIRIAGFCGALVGMYISAQFSVDGFSFSIDNRTWIGWALAGILIIIQSAWQRFGDNLTIFTMAMVCYIYGITTNVLGIIHNRGGLNSPVDLIIPIIFGALLEIFPEPFLAWSISGDISSDPLKKFIDRWS